MRYAMKWIYGRMTDDKTGERVCTYHGFPNAADRDAWIAEGAEISSQPNFREKVSGRDPELRRYLKTHAHLVEKV